MDNQHNRTQSKQNRAVCVCVFVFGVISVLVTCVCGAGILWH